MTGNRITRAAKPGRSRQPRSGSSRTLPPQAHHEHRAVSRARFEAVMQAAERSGLLTDKSSRIGGRVSPALVRQAKRMTGIETDTDLIAFALASIALEDNFAEVFRQSRGTVDPELKLGY